jgi:hypothetical protein
LDKLGDSGSTPGATPGGPTPNESGKVGEELLFDPHGSSELGHATVSTQHSHEAGREIRQNILLPGEEGWNKWLGNCYESWIDIAFPEGQQFTIVELHSNLPTIVIIVTPNKSFATSGKALTGSKLETTVLNGKDAAGTQSSMISNNPAPQQR